jgi:hypothetical protein
MRKCVDYKNFAIEAETFGLQGLWKWEYRLEKTDGIQLGKFIQEGPEVHRSAESALSSAIANGKEKIDGFTR